MNDKTDTTIDTPDVPTTIWGKIWATLKKWGLTGILSTASLGAGTWTFTSIDNLKDENIAIQQQLIDIRSQRDAMWRRLYHFTDKQQKTEINVEVMNKLYNIIVHSEKINDNNLPKLKFERKSEPTKSFEAFKNDAIMQQQQQQRSFVK